MTHYLPVISCETKRPRHKPGSVRMSDSTRLTACFPIPDERQSPETSVLSWYAQDVRNCDGAARPPNLSVDDAKVRADRRKTMTKQFYLVLRRKHAQKLKFIPRHAERQWCIPPDGGVICVWSCANTNTHAGLGSRPRCCGKEGCVSRVIHANRWSKTTENACHFAYRTRIAPVLRSINSCWGRRC